MKNIETRGLEYQNIEEMLDDRNANVFDPILLNGPIEAVKQKLNFLRDQGTDLHNIYQSFFHLFATEQTPSCPEFVERCVNNYSLSERVIMTLNHSTILCPINSSIVRKNLYVPEEFTLKAKDYNEESILQFFKESTTERKQFILRDVSSQKMIHSTHHSQSMQPCLMKKLSM